MATMTQARVDYEGDLFAWTQGQAALLRAHMVDGLDWENVAEEIESMGRRDRRELKGRLTVRLLHLLRWQAQADQRGIGWRKMLRTQRRLRRAAPGLRADAFPTTCPYAPGDVLEEDYMPTTDL